MLTLRLTQIAEADGSHRVEAALEGDGPRQTAVARFDFAVSADDRERVRWYLEDYLEYPLHPAPTIAGGVARRLNALGGELFRSIFSATDDARDLWATLRPRLSQARVEVLSDVADPGSIPWELIRDPKTDVALALRARAFVRAQHQTAQPVRYPTRLGSELRVLLVICRPAGDLDVPFRSVASRLVRLSREARDAFDLDVLRPPSFAQLERVLHAASQAGRPYQIVHFDGHGSYLSVADQDATWEAGGRLRDSLLSPPRGGPHGYLLFEDPSTSTNRQLVDGPAVGRLLVDTGVPVLVLNACRSAHVETPTAPTPDDPLANDVHARVRAYGSLAQEVVDAGVHGVVAMRYNVWVATAAQFIGDVYAELLQGGELGAAVTRGRRQLAAQPNRAVAFEPLPLQDWMVPVVYEAAPLSLADRPPAVAGGITIRLDEAVAAEDRKQTRAMPPSAPDIGFYGRDETLLALDRAFDRERLVLLHAYAGSGKTTTAAEFARWYRHTGGLAAMTTSDGPVLFSSFEHHRPLSRVLDDLGEAFQHLLETAGVHWEALVEVDKRRSVALQVLSQVPVLWIWDNVEPVSGFPEGAPTPWSAEEQVALVDFLRDLRTTSAKVLLTSRRPEWRWLGDLPVRVALPPLPMRDSVQLARAIVDRHPPHRLTEVEDWRPLLRLAAGNPLTITVLVGQALRENLTTREHIEAFVARLRDGEPAIADDERQGRSSSLAASLAYGLARAFNAVEREQLAVLHLFQGFVDADALVLMGAPERGDVVSAIRGIERHAAIALLDRASEIGLLDSYGHGYYGIHPALPWYFRALFDRAFGSPDDARAQDTQRAYAEAIAILGDYWRIQSQEGKAPGDTMLEKEEANLLHAWRLARKHGRWVEASACMTALRRLYDQLGRFGELRRLLDDMTPDLVNPDTGGPLPGREEAWQKYTWFRSELARSARDWGTAERLTRALVERARARTGTTGASPADGDATTADRSALADLAIALGELGKLLFRQRRAECLQPFQEAIDIFGAIDSPRSQLPLILDTGHAHLAIESLYDLDEAERWYHRGLALVPEGAAATMRANFLDALGGVHRRRLEAALAAEEDPTVVQGHFERATEAFVQALRLYPPSAVSHLAVTHDQLAKVMGAVGAVDAAVRHYLASIRYEKQSGNAYGAGQSRLSIALLLERHGRLSEALEYARAAQADMAGYAKDAQIPELESLVAELEELSAREQPLPEHDA